jgi:hypothetical protein
MNKPKAAMQAKDNKPYHLLYDATRVGNKGGEPGKGKTSSFSETMVAE